MQMKEIKWKPARIDVMTWLHWPMRRDVGGTRHAAPPRSAGKNYIAYSVQIRMMSSFYFLIS